MLTVLNRDYLKSEYSSSDEQEISNKLTKIILNDNYISSVDAATFQGLAQCTQICLSYNQLHALEPHLFGGLARLERLALDHNKLETLDSEQFDGLSSLVELDLSHNLIGPSINDSLFSGLRKLVRLDLSNNQLASLPSAKTFIHLDALRELKLNGNRLESIAPTAADLDVAVLSGLVELDLSSNLLKSIDSALRGFIHLYTYYWALFFSTFLNYQCLSINL